MDPPGRRRGGARALGEEPISGGGRATGWRVAIDPRQTLGKDGEDLACRELRRRGYAILERRYRTRFGEIDIVARQGETTVFVEVKARDGGEFGGAAAAVTPWKQRRLVAMAVDYMAR